MGGMWGERSRFGAVLGAVVLMMGLASCAAPESSSNADGLVLADPYEDESLSPLMGFA
ncbi:hypothetical protein [Actinomadura sp. KC06]|uniref:hypothetical protein n=1 Tax=Actinomadura sp. KC06 TaxID=2530369 RepID=UPI001A9CCDF3|nr:hypothetical protein [Actinomadura sp. KC06]